MRCAVYARFSSDAQHPASIEDQRLACQRYADRQGWQILSEHVYADAALSGMGVDHRPAYRRLLAAVAAPTKPFDTLLVDDLSRLSRDAAETLRLGRSLDQAGITLISVADGIETGTKLSKLALSVKAIFNELYLDDLRERTLRGLQGRFARGLHTGGRIYGYRSAPLRDPAGRVDKAGQPLVLGTALAIDAAEARVVRQIFEGFAGGLSLRAIAHRLNAEAIPFPAASTRRGAQRKGWAQSAVRVILLNEKYRGRWVYGQRIFFKDPVSGRRRARRRPPADWQVAEHPDLRLVSDELWQAVQARFQHLARLYLPRQGTGRLAGRTPGSPSSRTSLFSGLLRCGVCHGGMVVVNGHPLREHRRYGCGFHRDKGPHVCQNGLTVKVGTVETRLVAALQAHVLHPDAVQYLVTTVNQHLEGFAASEGEERRRLEGELAQVETELKHVEGAILAGLAGTTTAALLQDREGRREALRERLRTLQAGSASYPLRVNVDEIRARLAHLAALLQQDSMRANAVFREMLEPITMTPVDHDGKHFYRATGTARGAEMLNRLGVAQAVDFGGCGGALWIAGKHQSGVSISSHSMRQAAMRAGAGGRTHNGEKHPIRHQDALEGDQHWCEHSPPRSSRTTGRGAYGPPPWKAPSCAPLFPTALQSTVAQVQQTKRTSGSWNPPCHTRYPAAQSTDSSGRGSPRLPSRTNTSRPRYPHWLTRAWRLSTVVCNGEPHAACDRFEAMSRMAQKPTTEGPRMIFVYQGLRCKANRIAFVGGLSALRTNIDPMVQFAITA
ncbi:MAG: recombinase family protein [Candidatus Methylomirabilales bacterium]